MKNRIVSNSKAHACGGSEPEYAAGPCVDRTEFARGFTLVEILTILTLMGILAAMAAPRLDMQSFAVRGAVESVESVLLRAQRRAVQEQHPVVVAFDVAQSRLRIHDDTNGNEVIDASEPVRFETLAEGVRIGRGRTPAFFAGADVVSFSRTQNGLPAVIFRRDGSASEEGGFYLTTARALTDTTAVEDTRAARIQRSTGRPEWYRYIDGRWEPRS